METKEDLEPLEKRSLSNVTSLTEDFWFAKRTNKRIVNAEREIVAIAKPVTNRNGRVYPNAI